MGKTLTKILLAATALVVLAGSASAYGKGNKIIGRYPTQEDYETPGRKHFYSDETPGMDFDITSIDCDGDGVVDAIFEWEYKDRKAVSFKENLDAEGEPEKIYEFFYDISPETERPIEQVIIKEGVDDPTPRIITWDWNIKKEYIDENGDGVHEEEYSIGGLGLCGLWEIYFDGWHGLERRIEDHCEE